MPIFRIVHPKTTNKFTIRGSSIADVIEAAKIKFALPDKQYKLILEDGGFEIDKDEVLLEYAEQCINQKQPPITLIVLLNNENLENINLNDENVSSQRCAGIDQKNATSQNIGNPSENNINLQDIFKKCSDNFIANCENNEIPSTSDRFAMVNIVVTYMLETLKDTRRKTAEIIANKICVKYPLSFQDRVEGKVLGNGSESLRAQIYNSVNYRKNKNAAGSKRTAESDSDEEGLEARKNQKKQSSMQDKYGCIAYAPLMLEGETEETQETKRKSLLEIYNSGNAHDSTEISMLIQQTYSSQRALINSSSRDLAVIIADWPFLNDAKYLIKHASELLGKDVQKTWQESLTEKAKSIRQFFLIKENIKGKEQSMLGILRDAKSAFVITQNKVPKVLAIFLLLITHFGETQEHLFQIANIDVSDDNLLKDGHVHPTLIIRGKSLYDGDSIFSVVIEGKLVVHCVDALKALLLTFLMYYIFGICYPDEIRKTLEFIQRLFLKINPTTGNKRRAGSKRQSKSFDSAVFKLCKKLNEFTSIFTF